MTKGNVNANIESIVNDLKEVNYEQILYEAVTNSIQSNSTEINIVFNSNTLVYKDTNKYVDSLIIEDNGDGFTDDNTNSFKEYRTQLKRKLGCKGVGRFLYLKVFKKINIASLNRKINFVIDKNIEVVNTSDYIKILKLYLIILENNLLWILFLLNKK